MEFMIGTVVGGVAGFVLRAVTVKHDHTALLMKAEANPRRPRESLKDWASRISEGF